MVKTKSNTEFKSKKYAYLNNALKLIRVIHSFGRTLNGHQIINKYNCFMKQNKNRSHIYFMQIIFQKFVQYYCIYELIEL